MTDHNTAPNQGSFGDRLSLAFIAFARALVRLVLIVLVAGLIGVAIYFGVPRLYESYVVPVQQNTAAIADLRDRQGQAEAGLASRIEALQGRLDSLEVQQDQDKQTIADMQSSLSALQTGLQGALEDQSALLTHIEDLQAMLDQLETSQSRMENFASAIATQVGDNRLQINTLNEELRSVDNPINVFRRELELVKAMEFITRSRLFIAQNNEGLAQSEIERARELLAGLQTLVPDYQQDALAAIIGRLDLALGSFPEDLDLAANDLEVAWALLVSGLPAEPGEAAEAAAATVGPGTPTVTPAPTATGTPTPTPTP